MRFVPIASSSICISISRRFGSLPKPPKLPKLRKVHYRYRTRTILQAQQALTDYLHTTRSLSFTYADNISKNALLSLSELISRVQSLPSKFSVNFQRFLRYHPINEFEFFLESIGIPPLEIPKFLPAHRFFLSEDESPLNAACALWAFGFPWTKLGILYEEESSVFGKSPEALSYRLYELKAFGFSGVSVIGICLAFPFVLRGNDELSGDINALFDDLKWVFIDFDLISSVKENVDSWYEICRRIKFFYDLGCEKGKMGVPMGRAKNIFLDYPEEVLVQKAEYFCRFGVRKEDTGLLLLRCPRILDFDLENHVISAGKYFKHIGLSDEELNAVAQHHPYVLGRNKLANLPNLLRAVNLHEWFLNKIKIGESHLLDSFVTGSPDEEVDKDLKNSLEKLQNTKKRFHNISRLNFLLGIGFGENLATIKALAYLSGTRAALQERFDCLLHLGIEFSKLCKMVSLRPNILNQSTDKIKQKVSFLCNDMGCSLQHLYALPKYLSFSLESTIKPRYRFHMWLAEKGLVTRNYSLESILVTSEKTFITHLFSVHPAAPKQWLECFSSKNQDKDEKEIKLQ